MADTTYKRLDKDQLIFLVNYLLTKLKNSSLADNTTYTIARDGNNIVLKDDTGTVISTVSAETIAKQTISFDSDLGFTSTGEGYAEANALTSSLNSLTQMMLTIIASYSTTEQMNKAIADAVAGVNEVSFSVVSALPTTGDSTTIYLLSNGGSGTNIYDEYIYVSGAWEKIGSTDIDLSGYAKKSDVSVLSNAEITTIVDDAYTAVFGG